MTEIVPENRARLETPGWYQKMSEMDRDGARE